MFQEPKASRKRRTTTDKPASPRVMAKMMMEMPTPPTFKVFSLKRGKKEPGRAWTHLCSALEEMDREGQQALLLPEPLRPQVPLALKLLLQWGLALKLFW